MSFFGLDHVVAAVHELERFKQAGKAFALSWFMSFSKVFRCGFWKPIIRFGEDGGLRFWAGSDMCKNIGSAALGVGNFDGASSVKGVKGGSDSRQALGGYIDE